MRDLLDRLLATPWALGLGVLVISLVGGRLLVRILRPLLMRLTSHTPGEWDDNLVARLASPFALIIAVQGFHVAMPWVALESRAATVVAPAVTIVTTAGVLWAAFRGIDLFHAILQHRPWANNPASRSLLAIGARFTKVAFVLFGIVVLLAQLGVSVASLIAGLGIGGLALALAAQKTVENLFGTVSIGVDRPMREGDFVKVYDQVGTVEQIGLRSTRIRTLDRTVVTIPNGELANQRIESYTLRDRMRLAQIVALPYGTSSEQVRTVLADLEAILRAHPKIWPDAVVVKLQKFGESSIDIEVMAWFQTPVWAEFQGIRQDILLAFMDAVERAGAQIAVPARALRIAPTATAKS